ncbi:MAG: hypothetical protein ACRD2L_10575 [Terriglobia bacterium]
MATMYEDLWAGVTLKIENAGFFLDEMQRSLDRPRGRDAARAEAAGAVVDTQWQRAFYANLDAFLVMARSVPEVINCCFGKDTATKEMRDWFTTKLPQAEQYRRTDFFKRFESDYDNFRNLPLTKERNISFHRTGYPAVEVNIAGRFGVSYIGSPVKRLPSAESRPVSAGDDPDDPAVQWAATLPPIPVYPAWNDFQIDGKPLFPECRDYLEHARNLADQSRSICQQIHGGNTLTSPP